MQQGAERSRRARTLSCAALLGALALLGCSEGSGSHDTGPDATAGDAALGDADAPGRADGGPQRTDAGPIDADLVLPDAVEVTVLLDGLPAPDAVVVQGGRSALLFRTDTRGRARVPLDRSVEGDLAVIASHPAARIQAVELVGDTQSATIALTRYDPRDNPDYRFVDPGEPARRPNTGQCGHCHLTFDDEWFASPHRTSASNPRVQDLYAGAAAAYADEASCVAARGEWRLDRSPGGGVAMRCFIGAGALATVNPGCDEPACRVRFGGCADCHAPGIDGALGGRDLLDAGGLAYDYGVHCDVCHRVESVDLEAAPGVAGRLRLHRPREPASVSLGGGGYRPLTFGPSHDSPNPRMGSVQRDHFREATLCAGCHQHDSAPLVPGAAADPARWPDGRLPLQSTFAEWQSGLLGGVAPCQECHQPPLASLANGADLGTHTLSSVGLQGGWYRAPGEVRSHRFLGPRAENSGLLELAAALFVQKTLREDTLEARVTVRNVGAGHAIPTGEAMRSLVLSVRARCGDTPLVAVGGDAVPDFGGHRERRERGEDWTRWPRAAPGDRLRIVRRPGGHHDYVGFGPFGDGRFDAAEKGMPREEVSGEVRILAVDPSGEVTLSGALPDGDVAYLVRGADQARSGEPAAELAGAPGFGFARVLADAEGRRMAPSFLAVDVVSDNRLMPHAEWTSRHEFQVPSGCESPTVEARLYYRNYPFELSRERGWGLVERPIAEVRR
jgi:hypothetical protein